MRVCPQYALVFTCIYPTLEGAGCYPRRLANPNGEPTPKFERLSMSQLSSLGPPCSSDQLSQLMNDMLGYERADEIDHALPALRCDVIDQFKPGSEF